MEDFRRADPTYINFVPKTAADAIDLFWRMKRLGLKVANHPEAFVWSSRELNPEEGAKFEDWLMAPQGVSISAEIMKQADPAQEEIRKQLLAEAEQRDLEDRVARMRIEEEDEKNPEISPLDLSKNECPRPTNSFSISNWMTRLTHPLTMTMHDQEGRVSGVFPGKKKPRVKVTEKGASI
jgi:hypothetical protein